MIYPVTFLSGRTIQFKIYDYHYQNSDLKQQFANTTNSVIVLFEKTGDNYTLLETVIDNPENYMITQLPTDTLYKTNKVLLPASISFADKEDNFKNLAKEINDHFKNPIPCDEFD